MGDLGNSFPGQLPNSVSFVSKVVQLDAGGADSRRCTSAAPTAPLSAFHCLAPQACDRPRPSRKRMFSCAESQAQSDTFGAAGRDPQYNCDTVPDQKALSVAMTVGFVKGKASRQNLSLATTVPITAHTYQEASFPKPSQCSRPRHSPQPTADENNIETEESNFSFS